MSIEWYAIHTYVGHEEKVKQNILNRARSLGATDMIYQVVVPSEETVEHAGGGKKEVVRRRLFPGYIFVQMDLGENVDEPNEAWEVVRYTPGVTGFVGTSNHAVPLSPDEEARMLGTLGVTGARETPQDQDHLRRRRHRPGHLRPVRGLHGHRVRSEPRPRQAQGARLHLRP